MAKHVLDNLAAQFPGRFRVTHVVSHAEGRGDGRVRSGRTDKDMLLEALSPVTATTTTATLAAPPDSDYVGKGAAKQSKILVCGPPAMLAAVAGNKGSLRLDAGPCRGHVAGTGC